MRRFLKNGGCHRPKALLGADGAIMAAATLAAAGMNVAATANSAEKQASAMRDSAKIQAQSIRDQSRNSTNLQQESINFTRQQNLENRNLQQEMQTTLQLLAGQENMNGRLDRSKVAVKFGGRPKMKLHNSFYRGANTPFTVTDGGGVIPLDVDNNGYGLYEIYGNDHEHYHKTRGGKAKTGVGFKFSDGSVVEGEGNQNSSKGEKLFVTPYDAMFISKHSIAGFNPAKAVDEGMNPTEAFNIQEILKAINGYNNNGTKSRRNLRNAASYGTNLVLTNANQWQSPYTIIPGIVGGAAYAVNSPVERNNHSLKLGGRVKAEGGYWKNYGGATLTSLGNIIGAGINILGNNAAARTLSKAYTDAGNTIADAYSQMRGIDLSSISREDYSAPHAMAVVRSADTNINPQEERIRRNAFAERRLANRNTLSSAARQQRLAGINDRMYQRLGELYATKHNQDEQIARENASAISQTSQFNAQQDLQANNQYRADRLNLMQYNNDIENQKIAGIAGARAEGGVNSAQVRSQAQSYNASTLGQALIGSAQSFANTMSQQTRDKADIEKVMLGSTADSQAKYYASMSTLEEAAAEYDRLREHLREVKARNRKEDEDYIKTIKRRINTIAAGRGFDIE